MSIFLNALKNDTNLTYTENGALTHKTSMNALMDMFAMGAAYRSRSEEDCILLFKNAYMENPEYALKCLFYIADCRGGQGERRFFRVCAKWLANYDTEAMKRNLQYIPEYRRWDDLYCFVGTKLQKDAFNLMKHQLALDMECKTPSLLAKWLKSENTSSQKSRELANLTRIAFGMTHKQYRKTLSILRQRINIVERLMSENRWDEIEFDKIPSRAGLIYKNAFARRDIIKEKYESFAKSETTTVNAKALYPYEVVDKAVKISHVSMDNVDRLMINKYWDNLTDYFNDKTFNGLAVVDTSGSMTWHGGAAAPINVAISLGLYCAERAKGPFAGHYVSFASRPQLIKVEGVDFVDKVKRIYQTNLCDNTNIEATFDMLLNTALNHNMSQEDLPENILIISDMEFDTARGRYGRSNDTKTLMENIERKWRAYGYQMPKLVFWNVEARQNNIPMTVKDGISFVSGMSPTIFEQLMTGKTAFDLVMEVLNNERYAVIH